MTNLQSPSYKKVSSGNVPAINRALNAEISSFEANFRNFSVIEKLLGYIPPISFFEN
jgi:hypothetical protein